MSRGIHHVGARELGQRVGAYLLEPHGVLAREAVQSIGILSRCQFLGSHALVVEVLSACMGLHVGRSRIDDITVAGGARVVLPSDEGTGVGTSLDGAGNQASTGMDGAVILVRAARDTARGGVGAHRTCKEAVLDEAYKLTTKAAGILSAAYDIPLAVALRERAEVVRFCPSHDGTRCTGIGSVLRGSTALDGDTGNLCAMHHAKEHRIDVVNREQLAVEAALEGNRRAADGRVTHAFEVQRSRQTSVQTGLTTVHSLRKDLHLLGRGYQAIAVFHAQFLTL